MLAWHGEASGEVRRGQPNTQTPPPADLTYSGEQFDTELGWGYNRARYYNMTAGVWNRIDPYVGDNADPQSLHKYAYCHRDPVNGVDLSGLSLVQTLVSIGIHATLNAIAFGAISFTFSKIRGQSNSEAIRNAGIAALIGVAFAIPVLNQILSAAFLGLLAWEAGHGRLTGLDFLEILCYMAAGMAITKGIMPRVRAAGIPRMIESRIIPRWLRSRLNVRLNSTRTMASTNTASENKAAIAEFDEGGFSGVYDPQTGEVAIRPSGTTVTSTGEVPEGRLPQYGGHGRLNGALFGTRGDGSAGRTFGFTAILEDGELKIRWRSRSVNVANHGNVEVPPSQRTPILDALRNMFSNDVNVQSE